jgi:hypothetical protein
MKSLPLIAVSAFALAAAATTALAQPGPVASACKADIAKLCANLPHDGSVRACLMKNRDKVSKPCREALDATGPGRRAGRPGSK